MKRDDVYLKKGAEGLRSLNQGISNTKSGAY